MWTDLCKRFHQANDPRVFQTKHKLNTLVQDANDVSTYFTKLKILQDELKEFRPMNVCIYGAMNVWMAHQQDYILQFFMGLNESYSHIRA